METQDKQQTGFGRRELFKGVGVAGLATLGSGLLAGCGGNSFSANTSNGQNSANDLHIGFAAKIAEASAVTMYTGILAAPFYSRLPGHVQSYFQAAREEDMAHHDLIKGATDNVGSAVSTFYFPTGMFTNAQVTLQTMITLEEAYIAAYLVGVRDYSTVDLKVPAARVMGVQSAHRTLARVAAGFISGTDGGPFTTLKGLAGQDEPVTPPNNNMYERTYHLGSIDDAVTALQPFVNATAAANAGFDTAHPYTFVPFQSTAPNPLGDLNG